MPRTITLVAIALCTPLLAVSLRAQCPEWDVPTTLTQVPGEELGAAVALAGEVAVLGAPGWAPTMGLPEGRALLATRSGGAWISAPLPRPSVLDAGARLGHAVALDDDVTVVALGAPEHGAGGHARGLVVLYEWVAGAWTETYLLEGLQDVGRLGWSLDASADRVVIGEPGVDGAAGRVRVLRRLGPGTWTEELRLSGDSALDLFGYDVGLHEDLLAVGAPLVDVNGAEDAGRTTVHAWDGDAWTLRDSLVVSLTPRDGLHFGWAVDVSADHLLVGAPGSPDSEAPGGSGWLYRLLDDSGVDPEAGVYDPVNSSGRLGWSASLSSSRAALGTPGHDPLGLGADTGRARVMQRLPYDAGPVWTTTALVTGGSPEAGASFASSVSLSGQRLLVGIPGASPSGAGRVVEEDMRGHVTYTQLGGGVAPLGGSEPQLQFASGMCDSPHWFLRATEVAPLATAYHVVGLAELGLPFKGGVLVPRADAVIAWTGSGISDVRINIFLPPGLPPFSAWHQVWIPDALGPFGYVATQGLVGQTGVP